MQKEHLLLTKKSNADYWKLDFIVEPVQIFLHLINLSELPHPSDIFSIFKIPASIPKFLHCKYLLNRKITFWFTTERNYTQNYSGFRMAKPLLPCLDGLQICALRMNYSLYNMIFFPKMQLEIPYICCTWDSNWIEFQKGTGSA